MALIMSSFPPNERVKAMGWWSLVGAGGPVLGVSLGSPIIQYFGWRSLFWIQLVLLVLAFCVVVVVLPRRRGDEGPEDRAEAVRAFRTMDWVGSWSLSLSVTTLMLGLSLGHVDRLAEPRGVRVLGRDASSGVVVFVRRIRTSPNPLIPPAYFARRNFTFPIVLRCSANFAYFGAFFLAPLLMELGLQLLVHQGRPRLDRAPPHLRDLLADRGLRRGQDRGADDRDRGRRRAVRLAAPVRRRCSPRRSLLWLILALALSGFAMGVAMPATSSIMANEVSETRLRRDVGRPDPRDAGGRGGGHPGPRDAPAGDHAPPRAHPQPRTRTSCSPRSTSRSSSARRLAGVALAAALFLRSGASAAGVAAGAAAEA